VTKHRETLDPKRPPLNVFTNFAHLVHDYTLCQARLAIHKVPLFLTADKCDRAVTLWETCYRLEFVSLGPIMYLTTGCSI
jgi:hypothetical protein